LAIIAGADISFKKQPKQPGAAEGELFAKGQSGNATGPTRRQKRWRDLNQRGKPGCRFLAENSPQWS
jgi:hypothetical protein